MGYYHCRFSCNSPSFTGFLIRMVFIDSNSNIMENVTLFTFLELIMIMINHVFYLIMKMPLEEDPVFMMGSNPCQDHSRLAIYFQRSTVHILTMISQPNITLTLTQTNKIILNEGPEFLTPKDKKQGYSRLQYQGQEFLIRLCT